MVGVIKCGSTAETLGVGAGAGAAAGVLATLFSERPSLKRAVINGLLGGAGGAAVGGGVLAMRRGGDKRQVAPADSAPSALPPTPGKKLDVGEAAASGLLPLIGPGIHASMNDAGPSQAAGSALGSGLGFLGASMGLQKFPRPKTNLGLLLGLAGVLGGSAAGSAGAAAIGNKLREN